MIPETDAVRWACSNSYSAEKFDEWLAAHDREVRAQAWQDGYITRAFTPLGPGGVPVQAPANPYRLTTTTEGPTT